MQHAVSIAAAIALLSGAPLWAQDAAPAPLDEVADPADAALPDTGLGDAEPLEPRPAA